MWRISDYFYHSDLLKPWPRLKSYLPKRQLPWWFPLNKCIERQTEVYSQSRDAEAGMRDAEIWGKYRTTGVKTILFTSSCRSILIHNLSQNFQNLWILEFFQYKGIRGYFKPLLPHASTFQLL